MLVLSDVSTTMIIQPGPVVDFLIANQKVNDPYSVDWAKVNSVSTLDQNAIPVLYPGF